MDRDNLVWASGIRWDEHFDGCQPPPCSNNVLVKEQVYKQPWYSRCDGLQSISEASDRQTEPTRGHPDYDRLFKVRPIIDHVAKTFLERYTLGREVAVDEAMVAYTGKLSFQQWIPNNPIKCGMCCEAPPDLMCTLDGVRTAPTMALDTMLFPN